MLQLELSLFSLWANIAAAGWLTACIEQYSDPELGLQERQNPFFKRPVPAMVLAGHRAHALGFAYFPAVLFLLSRVMRRSDLVGP